MKRVGMVTGLECIEKLLGKDVNVAITMGGVVGMTSALSVFAPVGGLKELGIEGVFKLKDLLAMLRAIPDEDVSLEIQSDQYLIITEETGRRRGAVAIDVEADLEMFTTAKPRVQWKDLTDDVVGYLARAAAVATDTGGAFEYSTVHITKTLIEACDNWRFYRARVGLKNLPKVKGEFCVAWRALVKLEFVKPNKYAATDRQLLFKNEAGIILCCTAYLSEYPDFTVLDNFEGDALEFPKVMVEVFDRVDKAVDAESDKVSVKLEKSKVTVRSVGAGAWFEEEQKVRHKGPQFTFHASPKVLGSMLRKDNSVVLGEAKMKITTEHETYSTALVVPEN